jgi:hypothetical protein
LQQQQKKGRTNERKGKYVTFVAVSFLGGNLSLEVESIHIMVH